MIKVVFICNWGNTSQQLLIQYRKTTPGETGQWGCIKGVNNINDANYIIVMEGAPASIDLRKYERNTIICFPREPNIVKPYKAYTQLNLERGYTYNNIYHVIPNFNFLGKNYDFLYNLNYQAMHKTK